MERFEFSFSTATSEPPTGSQVRLDAADPTIVTRAWIRNLTAPGEDVYRLLLAAPVGSMVYLQDFDDHTRYNDYQLVGAPIDKATYVEFPVTYVAGSGATLPGQRITMLVVEPADADTVPPSPGPPGASYATPDDLIPYLGGSLDPARAQDALDAATSHVDGVCGQSFGDPPPAGVKVATEQIAVRFYRDPEAPFGVLGGLVAGETAAYARTPIPDVDAMLIGYHAAWGIA